MVELTCPSEENFEARHKDKMDKYHDLKVSCINAGWTTHLFAVEVGARGYNAHSLSSCLRCLGLKSRALKNCLEASANEALRTSFWIWFLRDNDTWGKVGFSERKRGTSQNQRMPASGGSV